MEPLDGILLGLAAESPARRRSRARAHARGLLTLTFNGPHAGVTAGAVRAGGGPAGWPGCASRRSATAPAAAGARWPAVDSAARARAPAVPLVHRGRPRSLRAAWWSGWWRPATTRRSAALLLRIDAAPLGAGRVEELRGAAAPGPDAEAGARLPHRRRHAASTGWRAPPRRWPPRRAPRCWSTGSHARSSTPGPAGAARGGVAGGPGRRVQDAPPSRWSGAARRPRRAEMTDSVLDDVYGQLVADVAAARRLDAGASPGAASTRGSSAATRPAPPGSSTPPLWPDELAEWAGAGDRAPARRPAGGYRPEPPRAGPALGAAAGGRGRSGWPGSSPGPRAARRPARRQDAWPAPTRWRPRSAARPRTRDVQGDRAPHRVAGRRRRSPPTSIWREVIRARRKGKPVVASMGDVAASGGYLVAAGADAIVAEPSTLTGSIGVFAAKPDLGGLLERLSVHREAAARGEKAAARSLLRPWTEAERAAVQRQVDAFYALFLDRVAEGRELAAQRGRGGGRGPGLDRAPGAGAAAGGPAGHAGATPWRSPGTRPVSARGDGVVRPARPGPAACRPRSRWRRSRASPPGPALARARRAAPELRALSARRGGLGPLLALARGLDRRRGPKVRTRPQRRALDPPG